MTAFCPWNVQTLFPNLNPTWVGLGEFMWQLNVGIETKSNYRIFHSARKRSKAFKIRDPVTKTSPYTYQQRLLYQI
ncbi:hypothetical protein GHT06_015189 [Daphnia sinensis]|uniref:Uncharacterized protein n=1 Tax=Daphnia sinensis TaxID=1820382 RepID=A0AAD5KQT8_9CRUS|nr:hypothetical protein GHT06_015189 [Daphnia sinensis]